MNNSSVWSKLGQIMVLQAFEEQPGAGTAASPPVLLLPPCPGRGRAGTGPGGRPWLCWWSSRRVGRTSGVLPALQKTPNHETQPSQPRAALSWSGPTSHTPAGFVTPNISQWFLSIIHGTEQQMSPAGQPCSKQGLQRNWGLQPHHSPVCHCSSPLTHSCNCLRHVSKCKNLLNALRCFYKIRDRVYNWGVFLLTHSSML